MLDPSPAEVVKIQPIEATDYQCLDLSKIKDFRMKYLDKCHVDSQIVSVKECRGRKSKPEYPTIIELHHRITKKGILYKKTYFFGDPHLTGIAMINTGMFLTVSEQQNISIYREGSSKRFFNIITDYGPIRCCKYDARNKVLVTGTDYGYVGVYRVAGKRKNKSIVPLGKMVKVNNAITSIDFMLKEREKGSFKKPFALPASMIPTKALKRKRNDSSDDSDSEDERDLERESTEFLRDMYMTIYGASRNEINVWDYHKKTIIDTIRLGEESRHVTSLLSRGEGGLFVGDTDGTISLFDQNTLVMKQEFKVLKTPVTCLADQYSNGILASSDGGGTIARLRKKESSCSHSASDEYVLFESIENNNHDVSCIVTLNEKEFVAGSKDGTLIQYQYSKGGLDRCEIGSTWEEGPVCNAQAVEEGDESKQ